MRVTGGLHGFGETGMRCRDQRGDHVVPAVEVVVERLHRHADLAGNCPKCQPLRTVLCQLLLGGVQDLLHRVGPTTLPTGDDVGRLCHRAS